MYGSVDIDQSINIYAGLDLAVELYDTLLILSLSVKKNTTISELALKGKSRGFVAAL